MNSDLPIKIKVPEDFFKEEVRCGYLVTTEYKKLWAVEMDMLSLIDDICNKYNMQYFALGGTLLGAVRHKGYIPWDDDIDILMPRNDYEKLIELSDKEIVTPYFLSSPLTEKMFWRKHLQLRNSLTTGVIDFDRKLNNNKGIFIDIFPLDLVPDSIDERNDHRESLNRICEKSEYEMYLLSSEKNGASKVSLSDYVFRKLSKFRAKHKKYDKVFFQYNKELAKYNDSSTNCIAHASFQYEERGVWNRSCYNNFEYMDFEFLKIRVPNDYISVLNKYFGEDCMIIPDDILESTHGGIDFDVYNSFCKSYKWINKKRKEISV